ncbi:hypothetical protein [Kitasatospora sp. MBT66]|uniref:hypothetical protein n=1 Tax=Kitasatospora sp. MBT66 TaxID=1444769 RepID=UPI0005BCB3F8|nr:hypothetical protein [Kitasatospora sp. MBT66]
MTWTTYLDVDGRIHWTDGDQDVAGGIKAACTDTPKWNPEGYPPHIWTQTGPLWNCPDCGLATVGRPICPDAEHRWSGDDRCQNCGMKVLDFYKEPEGKPVLPFVIE